LIIVAALVAGSSVRAVPSHSSRYAAKKVENNFYASRCPGGLAGGESSSSE